MVRLLIKNYLIDLAYNIYPKSNKGVFLWFKKLLDDKV